MFEADPKEIIALAERRRQHHLATLDYVRELVVGGNLQHVLIITQWPGDDVSVHSSWSSKMEELWLLARAQHALNRVLDGELGSTPRGSETA
jgi:hypothetical protein